MASEKEPDFEEWKNNGLKLLGKKISDFKVTTVFTLIVIFLAGFFLIKFMGTIQEGWFKMSLQALIVLSVLVFIIYLVVWVFHNEAKQKLSNKRP
ncbi:hypothetical protein ACFC90_15300 [Enterococcus casseliflavus]|uniref:hypothetical protein n=1 Tax=Enterococcus casseliflavus TaxID=37734 RepID=UPI00204B361A|nr:MAG TPA: hypothetical protein [Caudoviricetes sp.]